MRVPPVGESRREEPFLLPFFKAKGPAKGPESKQQAARRKAENRPQQPRLFPGQLPPAGQDGREKGPAGRRGQSPTRGCAAAGTQRRGCPQSRPHSQAAARQNQKTGAAAAAFPSGHKPPPARGTDSREKGPAEKGPPNRQKDIKKRKDGCSSFLFFGGPSRT